MFFNGSMRLAWPDPIRMRPDGITTKNIKSAVMPAQHVFNNVTKNFNKLQNEIFDSPGLHGRYVFNHFLMVSYTSG